MKHTTLKFKDSYGKDIFVNKWSPEDETKIKAVLQIAHGASEHSYRYSELAEFLVENGYIVYANDHRGHGRAAVNKEELGFFDYENGWFKVVENIHDVTNLIKKNYKDLPVFLMGHSMGSFLTRTYIYMYGKELKGAIVSGTGQQPGLLIKIGKIFAKSEIKKFGPDKVSSRLHNMVFGSLNNSFKPSRTEFDWLSRDEKEVDKYIEDELCGQEFTTQCIYDLFCGLIAIRDKENIAKIPKDLPMFIFSGDKDPVGNMGKDIKKAYNIYKSAGIKDVELRLYKDGRHEMINELNKDEVFQDVLTWLEKHNN